MASIERTMAAMIGPRWGVKRALAASLVVLVVAAGIAVADTKPNTARLATETINVDARVLTSFDRAGGGQRRYGKLEWIGGIELTSASTSFGGWSGVVVSPDGHRLLAVSDAGTWMTASLVQEGGRPKGLTNVRLGPLKALGAKALGRGRDRDAEAVALVEGDLSRGRLLIAFEQNHRIGTFNITTGGVSEPKSYLALPSEARRMPALKGLEAMTVLRGGKLKGTVVAIAERFPDAAGNHRGWLLSRGKSTAFTVTDIGGFDVTDAASLSDGSVLILERRFRWLEGVRMRIRYVKAQDIKAGARIEGETLIEADMSKEIDNMEALAVHDGPRGETILTLMSDDNFNHILQRTLLLQFAIKADDLASLAH